MPIYGHDTDVLREDRHGANEEALFEEGGGAGGAPVIISVEEIERLKTEMAISFPGPQDHGQLLSVYQ